MSQIKDKYDKLNNAVARLEESLTDYEQYRIDSIRDGIIQRFEFCAELAWKTLREYLLDQGYAHINSPKSVMRQAYEDGIINDDVAWVALMDARNLTSHTYDADTAEEIHQAIKHRYVALLRDLIQALANYCS